MVRFLLVVGERIAPGIAALDAAERAELTSILERAIEERPASVRRQLALFLRLVRWAPFLRYGRSFDALAPAQQDSVLRWFHEAPVAALRQGFWGVKTLVFMGYYGRPGIGEQIGYRPARDGNAVLNERQEL